MHGASVELCPQCTVARAGTPGPHPGPISSSGGVSQAAFHGGHGRPSCQHALGDSNIARGLRPVKTISFAKSSALRKDRIWPNLDILLHQTHMPFPLQFSPWLQSSANNDFSRSLTNT